MPAGRRPHVQAPRPGQGAGLGPRLQDEAEEQGGLICARNQEAIGRAGKKNGVFRFKAPCFDFPEFWLNTPGAYDWQAHRISCERSLDCRQEGPIVKFRLAG